MKDFVKGALKFVAVIAVLAAVAGGVLYGFFVEIVDVGHNAMAPTMTIGDRVLVWKTQELPLGAVALCAHPVQPGVYVMGRVVGRPDHVVSIERGGLQINGDAPDLDTQGFVTFHDAEIGRAVRMRKIHEDILDRDHFIFVQDGREPRMRRAHRVERGLFLMNDNRTHRGEDSRTYGEVDPSACVGRVFMRLSAAESAPELGHAALDIIE